MKGIKKHPKASVFVSLLGLALVLTVTTVFGAAKGGTFNKDGYGGAWEISVYNLSYNSATQRTSSNHRYLLENSGGEGKILKRKYTFTHRILTADGDETFDADGNPKVLRIESDIGAPLSPGAYQEHSDTLGLSIADLPGGDRRYKIHAYTRLAIYKKTEGTPLAQPDVDETSLPFKK